MVQLGIAAIVSDEVHNTMRRLQVSIARACGSNPALRQTPHVTLKQPFHARALDPVERYFDELAASVAPFEIRLEGIGCFEADRVIFLEVNGGPHLEMLRLRVLQDLAERFRVAARQVEDDRYRFHATLAYSLSEEQFALAWAAVKDEQVRLRSSVDTLGLFYYTGDLWILYKRTGLV